MKTTSDSVFCTRARCFGALFLLFGLGASSACGVGSESVAASQPVDEGRAQHARNIVFVVGDGMGLSQITAGMYANGNRISLERFPVVGLIKTHSAKQLVTDSAAGATAFACGKKTYNGAIAVDTLGETLFTIFEEASDKGMATGLAVTSTITHATPACFYAHQSRRSMYHEIAADLATSMGASGIDLAIGYGREEFNARPDGRDLLEEMQAAGVTIGGGDEFDVSSDWTAGDAPLALLLNGEPPRVEERPESYLPQATGFALERLGAGEDPFMLVIEGSQIDWGGHANDRDYILREMLDFEATLQTIIDFAIRDGETLVVVTADHETGGFAINNGNLSGDSLSTAFTTEHHTATMVPVFAIGPGAAHFAGIYDNTGIHTKMRTALGWD